MTMSPSDEKTPQPSFAADPEGPREGEIALPFDPATLRADGSVVFIGRVRSPWMTRAECPKNLRDARERGGASATVEIDAPYRPGLAGLETASHVVLLTWLDRVQRNLIVQKPRHGLHAKGVFALRSPVRPNPIGLHIVRLLAMDPASGLLSIDAIDVLDGTPLIDVKPYFPSIDSYPDATPSGSR
jgi:tRNA-Thr(GGU) m(6)t(6)A37 methyltransferase TsaA